MIRPIVREIVRPPDLIREGYDSFADQILNGEGGDGLQPPGDWSKPELLNYLCDFRGFVAHGSNFGDFESLVPVPNPNRDISEFGSRDYVFASPDALWAMWFAVLDRKVLHHGTANDCRPVERNGTAVAKSYWFAVDERDLKDGSRPLTNGFMYLLKGYDFPHHNAQEWGSAEPVKPLTVIPVTPMDFPFADAILGYDAELLMRLIDNDRDGMPWFHDQSLWPVRPDAYLAE